MKPLCSHPHFHVSNKVNVCIRKLKNLETNMNVNILSQLIVEQSQSHNEYKTFSIFP